MAATKRATSSGSLFRAGSSQLQSEDELRGRGWWPRGQDAVGMAWHGMARHGAGGSDGSAMRPSGCSRGVLHRAAPPPPSATAALARGQPGCCSCLCLWCSSKVVSSASCCTSTPLVRVRRIARFAQGTIPAHLSKVQVQRCPSTPGFCWLLERSCWLLPCLACPWSQIQTVAFWDARRTARCSSAPPW